MVEFKAKVRGHEATEKANRIQAWQGLPGSWWSGLSQDATGSRWQVLSVQRRDSNDESKTTAATDQYDFHQCRSEICWQIRRQARRRHNCDDGESQRSNRFPCRLGGRVNMVVAHMRTNELFLETERWGGARGESGRFRQQSKGT